MAHANEPKKETVRITLPPREGHGSLSDTVRIQPAADHPTLTPGAEVPSEAAASTPPPSPRPVSRTPPREPMPLPSSSTAIRPPARSSPPAPPVRPPTAAAGRGVTPPSQGEPPPAGAGDVQTSDIAMPPRPRVLPPAPRVATPAASSSGVSAAPANYPGSGSQSGPKQETARISTLPEPVASARAGVKMRKTQPLLTVPRAIRDTPIITHSPVSPAGATAGTAGGIDSIPMPLIWAAFLISAVTLIIQIWNYFGS